MVRGRATLVVPQMAGRVPPPCGIIDARRVIHLSPTRVFAVVTTMPPPRDHRFLEPMTDRAELDLSYMSVALAVARAAGAGGEGPVGAVVVRDGLVVASAANAMVTSRDATAHAEVRAIRAAQSAIGDARLSGCILYVTLEPCAMCAGAIVLARLDRVVFGAWDDKAGMVGSVGDLLRHPKLNHRPEVAGGVMAEECGALLRAWFATHREG